MWKGAGFNGGQAVYYMAAPAAQEMDGSVPP